LAPGEDVAAEIVILPDRTIALEKHNGNPTVDGPSLKSVLTSGDFAERDEEFTAAADKALKNRPYVSIRMRLGIALSLLFLLTLAITLWTIRILADVHGRILFLEAADDYKMEIQQARRFEKDFLLYATNLEDAREHARAAQRIASQHAERFRRVAGEQVLQVMNSRLTRYVELLDALGPGEQERYEAALRDHGAELLELAQDFVDKERGLIDSRLALASRVPFVFLFLLAVCMVLVVVFIARQIVKTLSRFLTYTERIASGDFTPIMPSRWYRDEFSELALRINSMVRELDQHQRTLVESHKLRAMGTLIAGVAHELNNPMNNILLTASVLQEEHGTLTEDETEDMLEDLISQSERTKRIVSNLLDFARESDVRVQPLDMRTILQETVQLIGNHIKMKKIRLTMDVDSDLPVVHGDRQLLSQVFMNLILNAVDVLPEKGEVRVSTSTDRREGYLAVDISDNGPGIPEHIMNQIFDPFFTTKPRGKGTGLGLSVSRGIVRKLGGYLSVDSQLHKGTTFTVFLPFTAVPTDIGALRHTAVATGDGALRVADQGV
jgi:two-component system NtrC family sensor kinase